MLDVRGLRVLQEVARQGSFTAAAAALPSPASAVSQQIAAAGVGVALIPRRSPAAVAMLAILEELGSQFVTEESRRLAHRCSGTPVAAS